MTTEIKNRSNFKTELIRWIIQLSLFIFAIPYSFLILGLIFGILKPIIGSAISLFLAVQYLFSCYLISVYFHFNVDKNKSFNKSLWKSIRLYLTIFVFGLHIFILSNIYMFGMMSGFILPFLFYIFCIIYSWMLSEYFCKKLKAYRNSTFNYPIWFSARFIIVIFGLLFWALITYIFSLDMNNSEDYAEYKRNYNIYDFIKIFCVIFVFVNPFLILNFISELKNRKLNSLENKSNN